MNKGEEKKIHEILESGSIGYAYLFDAKARKKPWKKSSVSGAGKSGGIVQKVWDRDGVDVCDGYEG